MTTERIPFIGTLIAATAQSSIDDSLLGRRVTDIDDASVPGVYEFTITNADGTTRDVSITPGTGSGGGGSTTVLGSVIEDTFTIPAASNQQITVQAGETDRPHFHEIRTFTAPSTIRTGVTQQINGIRIEEDGIYSLDLQLAIELIASAAGEWGISLLRTNGLTGDDEVIYHSSVISQHTERLTTADEDFVETIQFVPSRFNANDFVYVAISYVPETAAVMTFNISPSPLVSQLEIRKYIGSSGSSGLTLAQLRAAVASMVQDNTETGIIVTYQNADNTIDFVIGDGAITNNMLAEDSVDRDKVADRTIESQHIADAAVDDDRMLGTNFIPPAALETALRNTINMSAFTKSGTAPSTPADDDLWIDTSNDLWKIYDSSSSSWITIGGGGSGDGGLTAVTTNTTLTGSGTSQSPLGIAVGGVKTPQIGDGQVSTIKVADGAITHPKLGAGAVENENISDNEIELAKMSATARTQINRFGTTDETKLNKYPSPSTTDNDKYIQVDSAGNFELVDAPSGGGGGGLNQGQVDARIATWARAGNTDDIPDGKRPVDTADPIAGDGETDHPVTGNRKLKDIVDAFTEGGWRPSTDVFVGEGISQTIYTASNITGLTYTQQWSYNLARETNKYVAVRVPIDREPEIGNMRVAIVEGGALNNRLFSSDPLKATDRVTSDTQYIYYSLQFSDFPVGDTLLVEEFTKSGFDRNKINLHTDEYRNVQAIPASPTLYEKFNLTEPQTYAGHYILTVGAASGNTFLGYSEGATGSLQTIAGADVPSSTSDITVIAYYSNTHTSTSLRNSVQVVRRGVVGARTPSKLTINGVEYDLTATGGTFTHFYTAAMVDGSLFTDGHMLFVNVEFTNGTDAAPDRALMPGEYEYTRRGLIQAPGRHNRSDIESWFDPSARAGSTAAYPAGKRFTIDTVANINALSAASMDTNLIYLGY